MKNTKDPVKFSIVSIVINILLNWLLIDKMQYKGLALSTAIASGVNFLCLMYVFNKKYIVFNYKKIFLFFSMTLITATISLVCSYRVENTLLKLLIFAIVYLLMWIIPFYKKRMEIF